MNNTCYNPIAADSNLHQILLLCILFYKYILLDIDYFFYTRMQSYSDLHSK